MPDPLTDAALPYGSDPAWQAKIAQLKAVGSPLGSSSTPFDSFSNMGNLWHAGVRALATAPYVMAGAGSGQDTSDAMSKAATADFTGPLAGMTARDTLVKIMTLMYGPSVAAAVSSTLGPMDDPIRLMAQQAINGSNGGNGF